MEIREFAERVLFDPSLAAKLTPAPRLTDETPGKARKLPDFPARADEFSLARIAERGRPVFPQPAELQDETARATALHFFANHEIMALELMAAVLLAFPDAPKDWRRTVAATIRDEQRHARLYIERMADFGLSFGDRPVGDFFWRFGPAITSPMVYNAVVGMTLEQANLDFAHHYARVFRDLGDEATAEVLDVVLRDEIDHVHRGLVFLDKWKAPGQSTWEAWCEALPHPITPARAKGIGFLVQERRKAGLSEAFIERLRVFSASKGRPPTVFAFTPTEGWSAQEQRDLQAVQLPLVAEGDVLLVHDKPRRAWLTELREAGFDLPEFVVLDAASGRLGDADLLRSRHIGALAPWSWDGDSARLLAPLVARLTGAPSRRAIADVTAERIALSGPGLAEAERRK